MPSSRKNQPKLPLFDSGDPTLGRQISEQFGGPHFSERPRSVPVVPMRCEHCDRYCQGECPMARDAQAAIDWPDHQTSIHDELDLTAADLYDTEEEVRP